MSSFGISVIKSTDFLFKAEDVKKGNDLKEPNDCEIAKID